MKFLGVVTTCGLFLATSFVSFAFASDFSSLYAKVKPTVVMLKTNAYVEKETAKGVVSTQQRGIGSGVIVDGNYVLTASHVVNVADRVEVQTADGKTYAGRTVSSMPLADLAVVEILDAPKNLKHAKLGDSDKAKIGQEVIVVGAPYGLSQTLTVGNFSGRRINDDPKDLIATEFLQTDAPINQGNSGGPMFNSKGEVIGIVSHIRSTSGGSEGLGFAASINMAKRLFLDNPPPWVGMEVEPLTEVMADALNVPYGKGLLVQQVAYGSMADDFGLQHGRVPAVIAGRKLLLGGDVIVAFGGQEVDYSPEGFRRISAYLNSISDNGQLEMTVYRDGKERLLTATKHEVLKDVR